MKKLALLSLGICLSVVGFSFFTGVVGYIHGTAHMWAVGLPGGEFSNLDRRYRVHWQTSGCTVYGPELLTHPANNAAIAVMTTLFGPMPGTYHGPYPDHDQARSVLASSEQRVAIEALTDPLQGARDCATLKALFPPPLNMPAARCGTYRNSTFVLGFGGYATLRAVGDGARYARYHLGTDMAQRSR